MSDERPHSEFGARSSHDGPVPGHTAIEVDREIQFRQLVWLGGGLVAVALLSGFVVFFLLRGFLPAEREAAGPPPVMEAPPAMIVGPQLLARPEGELGRVRQLEAEQIDSYGWVDAGQGLVRIPIDRAVELGAAKGLPSRPTAPTGASAPAGAVPDASPGAAEASVEVAPTPPGGGAAPAAEPGEPAAAVPTPTSPGDQR